MTPAALDRAVAAVRTGTAGMAVAVALFLLLRIPLIATFRGALIVLAALELLGFGREALSRDVSRAQVAGIVVKLAVLAAASVALAGP